MLSKLENKLGSIQNEKEVVASRIKQAEQRLSELGGAEETVRNLIEEVKAEAAASAQTDPVE